MGGAAYMGTGKGTLIGGKGRKSLLVCFWKLLFWLERNIGEVKLFTLLICPVLICFLVTGEGKKGFLIYIWTFYYGLSPCWLNINIFCSETVPTVTCKLVLTRLLIEKDEKQ